MSTLPKHLLTAEEFAALPLEGLRSELIEGELRTMPPTSGSHGRITMRLSALVAHYAIDASTGRNVRGGDRLSDRQEPRYCARSRLCLHPARPRTITRFRFSLGSCNPRSAYRSRLFW